MLSLNDLEFLALFISPKSALLKDEIKEHFRSLLKTSLLRSANQVRFTNKEPEEHKKPIDIFPSSISALPRIIKLTNPLYTELKNILEEHTKCRTQFKHVFGADDQSIFSEKDVPEEFLKFVREYKNELLVSYLLTDADIAALGTPTQNTTLL